MYSLVAQRYAQALLDVATDQDKLSVVHHDLQALLSLTKEVKEFNHFLESPSIPSTKREEILEQILRGKINHLTFQFLLLLERKNRLSILKWVVKRFEELYRQAKGIVKVDVETSTSLNEHQMHTIIHHLREKFQKEIEASWQVKPEILGGIRIKEQDTIFDYSYQGQLERFRKATVKG